MKALMFALLIFCSNTISYSQQNVMTVEEIKQLGKGSLIEIATRNIMESISKRYIQGFDPANFDDVKVWFNKETVMVEMEISRVFIPLNRQYYTSASYNFTDGNVSFTRFKNPNDYKTDSVSFYVPDSILNNVLKRIYKEYLPDKETRITIYDQPEHYLVIELSEYFEHIFKFDKKSGDIYDETEAELARESYFEEMK